MAQQNCSYCGGPFNGGNCPSCSIVGAGNEFFHDPNHFPYDNTPDFMTNHYSTTSRHSRASYVGTILTMAMSVHHWYRLSISRNRATIKTLEKTIPLRDIISQLPSSIVITTSPLVLPIKDPEDSLIMRNKELDEVIKSSAEDFVLIPSESNDTSGSDSECDFPASDDFSPIDIPKGKSMTFSNPLFDSNDYFTSSDDESLSDKDVPMDNVKIYSNPHFEFDDEYISSNVNPLFDEVLEDIEKRDVLYLESLLSDDTTPNFPPE
nr:hypothetical protein [Tanacetum cinerariifolium]